MTTFQMIIVGLGGLLGVSTFWEQIKGFFTKTKKVDNVVPPVCENSLCDVVVCWEHLKDELTTRGLTEAVVELDKIFPLFVVVDEPKQPGNHEPNTISVGEHNE